MDLFVLKNVLVFLVGRYYPLFLMTLVKNELSNCGDYCISIIEGPSKSLIGATNWQEPLETT